MLQSPGCIFPSGGFMPSNKECSGNLLDLQIRLIHLRPHRETCVSLPTEHENAGDLAAKVSDLQESVCIKKDTPGWQNLPPSTCPGLPIKAPQVTGSWLRVFTGHEGNGFTTLLSLCLNNPSLGKDLTIPNLSQMEARGFPCISSFVSIPVTRPLRHA